MGKNWKETAGWLYKSVLIYSLAGIVCVVCQVLAVFYTIGGAVKSASEGDIGGAVDAATSGASAMDTIAMIAGVVVLVGYVIFFLSISKLRQYAHVNDAGAIGNIRLAFILNLIAAILTYFVPFSVIVSFIINLIAWIILIIAYGNLKNSSTFPEKARNGMGKLRTAMILSIIGGVVALIPFLGIIGGIISLFAFIWSIIGWKRVADSEAPAC